MEKSKFKKNDRVLILRCAAMDATYQDYVNRIGIITSIGHWKTPHRYNVTFDTGFEGAYKESELMKAYKNTRLLYGKKV